MHGLGVDLIHPVIAVVPVEIDLDAVGRRYAVQAVIVPHKRGGADGNVRRHKDAQCPGQHSAAAGRQLLDAGGDRREQHLEPGNRRKAPEEAVQQVDAPAQVERDRAVVPEHRTENDLGENAAQVLIRTAQQRAHDEQPAGGLVLVAIEQLGDHGDGQAPHDGERLCRNPLAHEEIKDLKNSSLFTEKDCLDALGLLSHLQRRLEESEPE